jgi:hypothetical protein
LGGGTFREELRGLLGAEMSLHRPDSDRIRRRIAAAVGPAPCLGLADAATTFTPYGGTEPAALADAASPTRTEFAASLAARHARPIDLDDVDNLDDLDDLDIDRLIDLGRLGSPGRPGGGSEPDGLADPADLITRDDRILPDDRVAPDRLDDVEDLADPHDGTTPLPLYGSHGGGVLPRRRDRRPRVRSGTAAPRRAAGGRTFTLVGAVVAVMSLTIVTALALFGMPGSDSPNPSTSTVTAPPHPTEVPWATGSATGAPSRQPETPPSAAPGGPGTPAGTVRPTNAAPATGGKAAGTGPTTGVGPAGGAGGQAGGQGHAPTAAETGIYASTTAPFPAGSRVRVPADAADWSLFGNGWGGVHARAALPIPLLTAFAVGTPTRSTSGFDWIGGIPTPFGVDETERLSVQGAATLSTFVVQARRLEIYLGSSSGQVRITVASIVDSRTFTVPLPAPLADGSSDARITLSLPAGIGATTVAISGDGTAPWTLAAAFLR